MHVMNLAAFSKHYSSCSVQSSGERWTCLAEFTCDELCSRHCFG